MAAKFESIDDYVASLPARARVIVEEVRRRIHQVAPTATETISYQMPTVVLDGQRLVHFAGWQGHLSIYPAPAPSDDADFEREFAPYRGDKGTAKFPYVDPMPYDLIQRTVERLIEQRSAQSDGAEPD
jgi:uncharacterized protein YdhG (YjbR/CyaY superfamily)